MAQLTQAVDWVIAYGLSDLNWPESSDHRGSNVQVGPREEQVAQC